MAQGLLSIRSRTCPARAVSDMRWEQAIRPAMPHHKLTARLPKSIHVIKFDFPGARIKCGRIEDESPVPQARRVLVKVVIGHLERWASRRIESLIAEKTLRKCRHALGHPSQPERLRTQRNTARKESLPTRVNGSAVNLFGYTDLGLRQAIGIIAGVALQSGRFETAGSRIGDDRVGDPDLFATCSVDRILEQFCVGCR
jgi:hypothetical protein